MISPPIILMASSGPAPWLHILLVLRSPDLDSILQMGLHKGGVERGDHLPLTSGHPSFDATQHTDGFLGCKCILLTHVKLFIHMDPQVLLGRAVLYELFFQSIHIFVESLNGDKNNIACHPRQNNFSLPYQELLRNF